MMTCTCGNFGCDVRIQRGLVPFCQYKPTATIEITTAAYSSYDEAAEAARVLRAAGRRARVSAGGGYSNGSARRFAVEQHNGQQWVMVGR